MRSKIIKTTLAFLEPQLKGFMSKDTFLKIVVYEKNGDIMDHYWHAKYLNSAKHESQYDYDSDPFENGLNI